MSAKIPPLRLHRGDPNYVANDVANDANVRVQ